MPEAQARRRLLIAAAHRVIEDMGHVPGNEGVAARQPAGPDGYQRRKAARSCALACLIRNRRRRSCLDVSRTGLLMSTTASPPETSLGSARIALFTDSNSSRSISVE